MNLTDIALRAKRITPRSVARRAGRILRSFIPHPNPYSRLTNWDSHRHLIEPHLKPTDVVLDVGSGHNPSPRANLLADYFPDDTIHRSHQALVEDRPVVVCSVERLPFLPGAFDFAICAHVLEHVDTPTRAVAELARVARAGYVETPAYGKDILIGTGNMHRWQVVEFEETLHFFEYSNRQRDAHVFSPAMALWIQSRHHPWQDFFWDRQDLFNARLLWKSLPKVMEYRRPGSVSTPLRPWSPVNVNQLPAHPCSLVESEIDMLGKRLATPDGTRRMHFVNGSFTDESGSIVYPVRGKRVYCDLSMV